MDTIRDLVDKAFAVDSIWSIVTRGVIWTVIALIIIINVDNQSTDSSNKKLKANLGFFSMFLLLFGGLTYLLFGIGAE